MLEGIRMSLSDIAHREAVLQAIQECERLGQTIFLRKYGFRKARDYSVWHEGKPYPSKAIAGVAHRYEFPTAEPLRAADFSGGEATVARKLRALGFEVTRTGQQKNPPWARDELILALDLYFRYPPQHISHAHPEVITLSHILNALPIHPVRPDARRFRNPNGVYMKLCNFLRLDPSYKGTGLRGGGAEEEVVWQEYAGDLPRLVATAAAIRARIGEPPDGAPETVQSPVDEEEEFAEGRVLFRAHRSRERNRALVDRAKRLYHTKHGKLVCQTCGFDFERTYGDLGRGFMECHHVVPVSQIAATSKTKVSDLAMLCANCHRMVHRKRPWVAVDSLSTIIAAKEQ
jgi:5-methylcytosine-specific restriction enzyme A